MSAEFPACAVTVGSKQGGWLREGSPAAEATCYSGQIYGSGRRFVSARKPNWSFHRESRKCFHPVYL